MKTISNIKKDIDKVNERIYKKKELMKEYPEDLRLKLSLESFEGRKEVLYHELENEYNKLIDEAKNVLEINSHIIESLIEVQEK
ncbi:MAG: hypothetical protein LBM96_06555 [Methanobrevibacter sp.]|jgi:hypothetical protein|nr:hypothetical protein [Candidatus Methanoflexus mossambicus]